MKYIYESQLRPVCAQYCTEINILQHQTASVSKLHIFTSFPCMKTYEHPFYSYHSLCILVDMLIYTFILILWRPSWIFANLGNNGGLLK